MEIRFIEFSEQQDNKCFLANFKIEDQYNSFKIPIKIPYSLVIHWYLTESEVRDFILDYGLSVLYKKAIIEGLSVGDEILFDIKRNVDKKPESIKKCDFQETINNKLFCNKASTSDKLKSITNSFACNKCSVPSAHKRCTKLTNIITEGNKDDKNSRLYREVISYKCVDNNKIGPIQDCTPDKMNCWVLKIP